MHTHTHARTHTLTHTHPYPARTIRGHTVVGETKQKEVPGRWEGKGGEQQENLIMVI